MKATLEELMDLYAAALLRYAERLVRNPHSAQDVVQQVFIKFSGLSPDQQPKTQAVRAWLYRATHHKAVDLIRSEQRRKKLHEAHAEAQPTSAADSTTQSKQRVLEKLYLLDDKEKQVILLRLQEGLSYREISEVTGLKEGHVGYLLHQAVRQLAGHFQNEGARS
ncbi:RNA polymerase sigma factor [Kiritimatiellaeota bacterium B1221]|nr:RNA polymerase sigma factor [Kiritimatiellaeota bacterium B1221]